MENNPLKSANFVIKRPDCISIRPGFTQERKFCHQKARLHQHPAGIHSRTQILALNRPPTFILVSPLNKRCNSTSRPHPCRTSNPLKLNFRCALPIDDVRAQALRTKFHETPECGWRLVSDRKSDSAGAAGFSQCR